MTVRMYGFSIWLWGYVCGVCGPHLTQCNFHSVAFSVVSFSQLLVHTYVCMYMYTSMHVIMYTSVWLMRSIMTQFFN